MNRAKQLRDFLARQQKHQRKLWLAGLAANTAVIVFLVAVETFASPGFLANRLSTHEELNGPSEYSGPLPSLYGPWEKFFRPELDESVEMTDPERDAFARRVESVAVSYRKVTDGYESLSLDNTSRGFRLLEPMWKHLMAEGFNDKELPVDWYKYSWSDGIKAYAEMSPVLFQTDDQSKLMGDLWRIRYRVLGHVTTRGDVAFVDVAEKWVHIREKHIEYVTPAVDKLLERLKAEGILKPQ